VKQRIQRSSYGAVGPSELVNTLTRRPLAALIEVVAAAAVGTVGISDRLWAFW
jgi:hypothetical protein